MKKIKFLGSLFLLIVACNFTKNSKKKDYFQVYKHSLMFPLNSREKDLSYDRLQILHDSLIFFSNRNYFISIFNLNNNKYKKIITFKKHGPNDLKDAFRYWYVKNLDSIFFIGKYSKNLNITNLNGNIIFKTKIKTKVNSFDIAFNSPLHLINNQIVIPTFREHRARKFINTKLPAFIKYNFVTNKTSKSSLNYLKATEINNHPMLQGTISCLDSKRNRLIYLFKQQNKIFIIDKDNNINSSNFVSKYSDKYEDYFNSDNFTKASKYFVEASNNFNLFYDKYRDLFYLIVSLGIPYKNDQGLRMNFNCKPFSILVLNNKLKVIAEQKFKGSTYEIRNCFVAKNGLYISENNSENESLDENKLSFSLFQHKNN